MAELRSDDPCRDLRHSWRPRDGGRQGRGYFRILQCTRCGTLLHQTLNRFGEIRSRSYTYPPGYLVKGGRLSSREVGAIRLLNLNT